MLLPCNKLKLKLKLIVDSRRDEYRHDVMTTYVIIIRRSSLKSVFELRTSKELELVLGIVYCHV